MEDITRWDWKTVRFMRRRSEGDPSEAVARVQARLARRYKGLDEDIIRAAWRRHFDREPTDEMVASIREGRRVR